jgi:putative ABC transport system substrate-binding protein
MRRLFSVATLLALLSSVGPAASQQEGRIYRIGFLWIGTPEHVTTPFEKWTGPGSKIRDALAEHGFVVGKNLVVDIRHAYGDMSRLPVEARSLVMSGVDLIFTDGTPPTVAAMQITSTVPIVFHQAGDPVEKGLIRSLAQPGANVTGTATLITQPKLLQFLKQMAPETQRAAVVGYAQNKGAPEERVEDYRAFVMKRWQDAAATAGMEYVRMPVNSLAEAESKLAELARAGNAGVVIQVDATMFQWRKDILSMALKHRLPSSCAQQRQYAVHGCLVTYTEDTHATAHRLGIMLVKILRGARPADIPAEEPASFKLIINDRTAKALGLGVPPLLRAFADEVIE